MRPETSALAKWSLGLVLLAIVLPFIYGPLLLLSLPLSVVATVMGVWAFITIRRSKGALRGAGIALGGAILGTLAIAFWFALVVPAVLGMYSPSRTLALQSNGRNIYVSVCAVGLEHPEDPMIGWSGEFESSTEFVRSLVEDGVMNVGYSFFGGPKMPKSDHFSAENNAWCVVADVDENLPESTPILFTRNINVTNLRQLTGPIEATFSDEAPFGKKVAVVVCAGGTAITVRPEGTWEERFSGAPFGDHPVLRP